KTTQARGPFRMARDHLVVAAWTNRQRGCQQHQNTCGYRQPKSPGAAGKAEPQGNLAPQDQDRGLADSLDNPFVEMGHPMAPWLFKGANGARPWRAGDEAIPCLRMVGARRRKSMDLFPGR